MARWPSRGVRARHTLASKFGIPKLPTPWGRRFKSRTGHPNGKNNYIIYIIKVKFLINCCVAQWPSGFWAHRTLASKFGTPKLPPLWGRRFKSHTGHPNGNFFFLYVKFPINNCHVAWWHGGLVGFRHFELRPQNLGPKNSHHPGDVGSNPVQTIPTANTTTIG